MTVLVTHPGRQHSHRAALALSGAGLLAGYWSGAPTLREHFERTPAWARGRLRGYQPVELPPALVRWFPATPALRRTAESLLPRRAAAAVDFYACRRFDRQVKRRLSSLACGVVVACEISARDTFRAASAAGLISVLDAPSLHHAAQDRLHSTTDSARLHAALARVKDDEIALADHVLTVSELARRTYLDAGVPASKVHAIPLGADLELFRPPTSGRPDGAVRFLFAGATIHRKGFDVLLTALDRLAARGRAFELRLVGPSTDDSWRSRRWASSAGQVDQSALAEEMRRAHVLVLPSRNDSYGMVVAEALATGLPVIVSDQVGAKDLITPPIQGWIVAADSLDALEERLEHCVANADSLIGMSTACRRAAEAATWPAYSDRLVAWFRTVLGAASQAVGA